MSESTTRREMLTKAVWVVPAILTVPITPSFAQAGSSSNARSAKHAKPETWHGGGSEK